MTKLFLPSHRPVLAIPGRPDILPALRISYISADSHYVPSHTYGATDVENVDGFFAGFSKYMKKLKN
jgi:hypothetical protein